MKKLKCKFSNKAIFEISEYLMEISKQSHYFYQLPISLVHCMHYNSQQLHSYAQSVEISKMYLIAKYRTDESKTGVSPGDENYECMYEEMQELLSLCHDIEIYIYNIDDILDGQVSQDVINGLSFMLYSEKERVNMLLTNNEIYNRASELIKVFEDGSLKLPVKVNFYLQKNKNTLISLAQDIEQARIDIIKSHGVLDETTMNYVVPTENIEAATKDLEELFNIEQEVPVSKVNIDSLSDDCILTTAQMEAIMFMID